MDIYIKAKYNNPEKLSEAVVCALKIISRQSEPGTVCFDG